MSTDNSDDEYGFGASEGPSIHTAPGRPEAEADAWDVPTSAEPCQVYRKGPRTLARVTTPLGDLSMINLFGTPVAMMRELGRRSATEIREGALSFVDQFATDVVETMMPRGLTRAGRWMVDHWLIERVHRALPAQYLKMLRAFAEGSGHQVERVLRAQLAWDLWAIFARAPTKRLQLASGTARRHSPLFGSASVVLPTANDGPLHLRWLDNAAVDRWDRKASVVFFHPDRGLSYVLVSSVGFLNGLPAGMNAAGLTVTVEPGRASSIDWDQTPLGWPTHQLLQNAHTIEQAAALLRQHCPMVPWRYVVSEGDTGRTAVLDSHDDFSESNRLRRAPFAEAAGDADLPGHQLCRIRRWYERRRRTLNRIVDQWSASGDDAVFAAMRAMTRSTPSAQAGSNHPLSGLSNVSAVVFEPANRRLWVATGRAPVARRWFVPLSLRHAGDGGLDRRARPLRVVESWEKSTAGQASDHLRLARQLDLDGEDDERILITAEHALALESRRPHLHILVGLIALRVGRNRRAEGAFRRALELLDDAARRAEATVYLAWSLDLQHRRREAKDQYRDSARNPAVERQVRQWARKGRRRRFRRRHVRTMVVDYFLATVFFDRF